MKWVDSDKYTPADGSMIWVWNTISQKQELFIVKWLDGKWIGLPIEYAKMWAYVFDGMEPTPDPRNLNVLSERLGGKTMFREFIHFADRASLRNFLEHLIRNNCTDYDIEKIKKACDILWKNE